MEWWLVVSALGVLLVGIGFALAVRVHRRRWQQLHTLRNVVAVECETLRQAGRLMDGYLAAREQLRQERGR